MKGREGKGDIYVCFRKGGRERRRRDERNTKTIHPSSSSLPLPPSLSLSKRKEGEKEREGRKTREGEKTEGREERREGERKAKDVCNSLKQMQQRLPLCCLPQSPTALLEAIS
jgi:hypothetical protein